MIERDERGPFLMIALERADEARLALIDAGIPFDESDADGAGCAGPQIAVLRFTEAPELDARVRAALG